MASGRPAGTTATTAHELTERLSEVGIPASALMGCNEAFTLRISGAAFRWRVIGSTRRILP